VTCRIMPNAIASKIDCAIPHQARLVFNILGS